MSVVGFDFGNHKCVVAVARRRGIDVLQNEVGSRSTPSMVAFSGRSRLIGTEAFAQQSSNPKNTVNSIKRLVGRRMDDPTLAEESFNFSVVPAKHNPAYAAVEVSYDDKREVLASEQLVGALLTKLKGVAELGLEGAKVTDCVISCPPWWNDAQRRSLLDGANVAGLNVLRCMNETSAIGLNYGILRPLPKDKENKVLFLDMGQSSTNAAVISFTEGKLQVLATASDPQLGGRSFDDLLVSHFAAYIKDKYRMDVTADIKAMLKLRKECERVKLHLSANSKVQFNVEYIMNDRDVSGQIERAEFETLAAQALLPRLVALVSGLVQRVGIKKEELQSLEVVGGSVRIPAVQKALQDWFGRDLSKTCDGDESVARGCALMCAMISPSFKVREFQVQDISPYSIALEWGAVTASGQVLPDDATPLFQQNNPIPSVKLISFNDRTEPFQLVARYSNEAQLPPGTLPVIGRYVVSGMPSKSGAKVPKIKVRVKLNLHGTVVVSSAQLIEEIEEDGKKDGKSEDVTMADAAPTTGAAAAPAAADGAEGEKKEEKMDTSDAGTEAGAKDVPPAAATAKRKVKHADLKVESFPSGGLDGSTLTQYFEKEATMANQDRVIAETLQSKNDLESYILEMRNKLSDDLSAYVSDSDRSRISSLLTDSEDWLYGDGYDAQRSEYKRRLTDLKALGDPVIARKYEADHRAEYAGQLKQAIGHYQRWAQQTDDKTAHVTADERKKLVDESNTVDEWLASTMSQLDRQPKTVNPTVTCAQLKLKKETLDKFAQPIVNKPKPTPPPPAKDDKKPGDAAPAGTASPPPQAASPPPAGAEAPKMDTSS